VALSKYSRYFDKVAYDNEQNFFM